MILDSLLKLAGAQSGTVSVASTNTIDCLAGGDAYAGGMAGLFFVIRVSTAFTATGSAVTAAFQLQTSSDDTFTQANSLTLVQSAALPALSLPVGTIIALPIPAGAKRYIRGYRLNANETAGTNVFSAGAYDMYITKDAPITRERA